MNKCGQKFNPKLRSRSTIERPDYPTSEWKNEIMVQTYQRNRELSPVYQARSKGLERLKLAAKKGEIVGRPPALASAEVQKLIAQYPDKARADRRIIDQNKL